MSLNPSIRLAPITADTPIGDVKQRIINQLTDYNQDAFVRVMLVEPEVCTTGELSIPDKQLNYRGGVVLGPNVFAACFVIFLFALLTTVMIDESYHPPFHSYILFHPLLLFVTLFAISYLIYRKIKPLHRKIRFDHNGITIHDDRFEWSDIIGTYILLQGQYQLREHRTWTMVIINRQGDLYSHNIENTSVSREMFCTLVEYYRN